MHPTSRPIERREFQRQVIAELRDANVIHLDDPFLETVEKKLNKTFPPGRRIELGGLWADELLRERILVAEKDDSKKLQLNPQPIVGETALERFDNLPADSIEQRLPLELLTLYAINSFLFLILSFFFLPESVVKVLGSAAGVGLGVLGLKSLNPRETNSDPRVWPRRFVGLALAAAGLVQAALLLLGFLNPCRIYAVPHSTISVDGKFLESTPDPPEEERKKVERLPSPANIQPWLTPWVRKHYLRWETHEIKVTKKWHVDNNQSEESRDNVFVDLVHLWNPAKAFDKWTMKAALRPRLKIATGGPGAQHASTPSESDETTLTAEEFKELVGQWNDIWTAVFDDKDLTGSRLTEHYTAALFMDRERIDTSLKFQIRDWMDKPVAPPKTIPSKPLEIDVSAKNQNEQPLKERFATLLREQVFDQLCVELDIAAKIEPTDTGPKLAAVTQRVITASVTPTPTPTVSPLPATSPGPNPSATEKPQPTASTPAPAASPSASVPTPELKQIVDLAAKNNQLNVVVAAQQQLARFNSVDPSDSRHNQSQQLETTLKELIKENTVTNKGRVYLHIADETQRDRAGAIGLQLKAQGFAVIGIQNVGGGRAYIPDTAEVRFFAYPEPKTTQETAKAIVRLLVSTGVKKSRPSYVVPSAQEKRTSIDLNTHFEIWFARDSFSTKGD